MVHADQTAPAAGLAIRAVPEEALDAGGADGLGQAGQAVVRAGRAGRGRVAWPEAAGACHAGGAAGALQAVGDGAAEAAGAIL